MRAIIVPGKNGRLVNRELPVTFSFGDCSVAKALPEGPLARLGRDAHMAGGSGGTWLSIGRPEGRPPAFRVIGDTIREMNTFGRLLPTNRECRCRS